MMTYINSLSKNLKKVLTKGIVKKISLVLSLIMFFCGLFVAVYGLFGIFFLSDLFFVYKFIYSICFITGGVCGLKTSTVKDNPEKDRKFALAFLTSHIILVLLYVLEKITVLATGREKEVLDSLYIDEEWLKSIFPTSTVFFIAMVIANVIAVSSALSCCLGCMVFSYLNVRYTAQEIEAPYQMVKTEDEDSEEALVELNEDELNRNNEELNFVEKKVEEKEN